MPRFWLAESLNAQRGKCSPDSRIASARPWKSRADSVATIPINGACVDLPQNLCRSLARFGIHPGGQTVSRVGNQSESLLVTANFLNSDNWAESFFTHQFHRMIDVHENSRLEIKTSARHALSTAKQFGSFFQRIT